MSRFIILVLLAAAGCGHPRQYVGLPAPDPQGCYVMVYDQPQFRGIGDVLNGPGRWPTLEGLRQTNEKSWRNRIRSLQVGRAASVTVYTDAAYAGDSRQFDPKSEHPRLEPTISGQIESLQLRCLRTDSSPSLSRSQPRKMSDSPVLR